MGEVDQIIQKISPHYRQKKESALKHVLGYDSSTEGLEPVYFWVLDFMGKAFGSVNKVVDNFASSPGSGHFSELQGKMSQMQQEASRVLGTVNNILKGVLNLIYDLKEFKIRLSHYDEAKSKDNARAQAGILALKQMWMDKVDVQRGQGSINALTAGDLNFVTLRDAFLASKSVKGVDDLDLNERVKRILKPRLQEFFEWRKRSESELRKRFEVEKIYLKSQVDALKLNSRWAKPYLKAAEKLKASEKLSEDAALVNVFNTLMLEVTIIGKNESDVKQAVIDGDLPEHFKTMKKLKQFYSIVIVDFNFRGIPSKAGQHYVFGGKSDVTFNAYALHKEEVDLLLEELNSSDLNDALKLVEGMTEESLEQLKVDLKEFFPEKEEEEQEEEGSNPFSALFSFMAPAKKQKEKTDEDKEREKLKQLKEKGIKPDSYAEKYVRLYSEALAMDSCFDVYDIYKKAHGMASVPYGGEKGEAIMKFKSLTPRTAIEKFFGFTKT